MTISVYDGITEATGSIIGAARLQGLLVWSAGLGLTLIRLTLVDAENAQAAASEVRSTIETVMTRGRSQPSDCDRRTFTALGVGSVGECHKHWPLSSRTSVADNPAPAGHA